MPLPLRARTLSPPDRSVRRTRQLAALLRPPDAQRRLGRDDARVLETAIGAWPVTLPSSAGTDPDLALALALAIKHPRRREAAGCRGARTCLAR